MLPQTNLHKKINKVLKILQQEEDLKSLNDQRIVTCNRKTYWYTKWTNKTKLQETFEFKLNKQKATFSFLPPINRSEERKWLIPLTCFEATKSVFNTTDENKNFLISTPGYWSSRGGAEVINKLSNLLELASQNDIELHVKEN